MSGVIGDDSPGLHRLSDAVRPGYEGRFEMC